MARQSNGKTAPKKKAAAPSAKKGRSAVSAKRASNTQAQSRQSILDDRSKRDIAGVACVILAIVLFVVAIMPSSGVLSVMASNGLHLLFGIGCYLFPFFMLLVAAALIVRTNESYSPVRVALGLMLFFLCLLIMFALYTPGIAQGNLQHLFQPEKVAAQGGYIGAAFAWVLYSLLGKPIGTIIVIGLMIISLIIVGFSVTAIVEKVKQLQLQNLRRERELDVAPAPEYLPVPDNAGASASTAGKGSAGRSRALTQPLDHARDEQATQKLPLSGAANSQHITQPLAGQGKQSGKSKAMTRRLGARANAAKDAAQGSRRAPQATAMPHPSEDFELPPRTLINVSEPEFDDGESAAILRETAQLLQETLGDFGVDATVVDWVAGPTVTLFKIDLPPGIRVSKVTNLTDDIARALAAPGVRIFSPVPGTNYVGIEVPNVRRQNVLLGDILPSFGKRGPLQVAIGKDVEGNCIVADLADMPHLLIGGTTGSGKSVSINGMIMSILMNATPAEVRFIMIDPKRVEFTPYNGIPHLYVPVVTECREAASALSWAVAEMERRLKVFSKVGARNISQYNAKAQAGMMIGDEPAAEVPYMVIIIDELADLMMNVGKEVELSISRLAQLARAAGIHMIVATQRPSTNVVTGLIKSNITNRIAFNVASGIDSRVILDQTGAENLIGKGDMLMSCPEYAKPRRLQGCFISEDEINDVVDFLKEQGEPEYHHEILNTNVIQIGSTAPDGSGGRGGGSLDPLIWEAAEIVVSSGLGSTSNIQRRLSIGYARAGRIMDMLEEIGVVGPPNGSRPREVLVDELELETLKAFEMNDSK